MIDYFKNNKGKLMPLLVLGGGVFIFVLLVATRPETRPADIGERVWSVQSRFVQFGDYTPRIETYGELRARREVELRAQVAGDVIRVSPEFEEGAFVAKGAILLEIDPFDYKAAVDDAAAQVASLKAMVKEAEAATAQAEQDLTRTKNLLARGTLSQKTLEDRSTDFAIKQARLAQAGAQLARGEVALARAERALADTKIIAPFDGYLNNIAAREGQVLARNAQLASLSDAHNFDVLFNLSDAEYGRFLRRGAKLIGRPTQIFWDIGGSRLELAAVIERVGAQISQTTRGVDIYARLQGSAPDVLRGGAFVNVVLEAQAVAGVVAIPKTAVYGENLIYLIEKGRLVAHYLDAPLDVGTDYLIRSNSGLKEGQEILLTRFNEAASGVAVKPAPAPTQTSKNENKIIN